MRKKSCDAYFILEAMRRAARAFTLIELLVVIAIIGILSSVVLASLNAVRAKGRIAAAKQELGEIKNAISVLSASTGLWPGGKTLDQIESGSGNEIWDLGTPAAGLASTDGSFPTWGGPYMKTIPNDPWGNPYFMDTDYQVDTAGNPCQSSCAQAVVIGSFGPNGVGQNTYDADDIILILSR